MNSEGVVLEYSSEPSKKLDEIIAEINAHYGTSFYQEDDIDKDFTIGETMPDWNAYEKILLDILNVKFSNGFFGKKVGDKLYIATSNGSNQITVDVQGGFVGSLEGPVLDETVKNQYFKRMRAAGFEIQETLAETLSLQVGDYVEGWSEMTLVN